MIRKVVAALAAAASLTLGGTAVAAPRLIVGQTTASQSTPQVTITMRQKATDAQPARLAVFVPAGYRLDATAAAGTVVGSASGNFFLRDENNRPQLVSGDIVAASTATKAPAACAAGTTHRAVWLIRLSGGSLKLEIPVFVNAAQGAEAAFGGQKLLLCLGPANVGKGVATRSPSGAQLLRLALTLDGVLTPPIGPARWRATVTPYRAGTGAVATSSMVELRSFVGPGGVVFHARRISRIRHLFRFTGRVTQAGVPVSGVVVRITVNGRSRFTATTQQNGGFRITRRVRGHGARSFRAVAIAGMRDITPVGCSTATETGVRCVSATSSPFRVLSRILRLHL